MAIDQNSIQNGSTVYGSDGDKIGDVSEVGSNYVLVTKGFLFTKDIYVPTSAVTGVEGERVYLNVTKDQVDNMGWDSPPAGDAAYARTAGSDRGTGYTDETTTSGYTRSDDDEIVSSQTTTTTDTDYVETARPVETQTTEVPATRVDDDDTIRVQRYEEELQAETVEREAGSVRVSKDVVEEQQTLEVPVTREEVRVRSVTVDRSASDTGDAFQEATIEVPIREEEVQIRKETRVAEELEIERTAVQDTETVTDTVRKERVNVEEIGDVDVQGGRDFNDRTRRS